MRFKELRLEAFGCFTSLVLEFRTAESDLHIVFGENEAGKSTALVAVERALFGIEARTSMDFIHPQQSLRIGATIEAAGQTLRFVRRKGKKNTLSGADGSPLPDSALAPYLGGLDRNTFASSLGIDYHKLRIGGQELLAGKGALREALYSAATGAASLSKIRTGLVKRADELFRPSGKNPRLNESLSAYKTVRDQISKCMLLPSRFQNVAGSVRAIESELVGLKVRQSEVQSQKHRLNLLRGALTQAVELRHCRQEFATLNADGPLPVVSPELQAEFDEAQKARRDQLGIVESLRSQIDDATNRAKELVVDGKVLDQAHTITDLHAGLGRFEKNVSEQKSLEARLSEGRYEHRRLGAEIAPSKTLDEIIAQFRVPATAVKTLQSLAKQFALVSHSRDASLESLRQVDESVERLKAELTVAPNATELQSVSPVQIKKLRSLASNFDAVYLATERSCSAREQSQANLARLESDLKDIPVKRSLNSIRTASQLAAERGDIESELLRLEHRLAALDRKVNDQIASFGLWSGNADSLLGLALPMPTTVEEARVRREKLAARLEGVELTSASSASNHKSLCEQLKDLELGKAVPTEEDLTIARGRREAAWQLVRSTWLDEKRDVGAVLQKPSDSDLANSYEQTVKNTDDLADRMRHDADQVTRKQSLVNRIIACESEIKILEDQKQASVKSLADDKQKWVALWSGSKIAPLSPVEMLSWLANATAAREAIDMARTVRSEVDSLRVAVNDLRTTLLTAVGDTGKNTDDAATIRDLMALSTHIIESSVRDDAKRESLVKQIALITATLKREEQAVNENASQLSAWYESWETGLTPLLSMGSAEARQIGSKALGARSIGIKASISIHDVDTLLAELGDSTIQENTRREELKKQLVVTATTARHAKAQLTACESDFETWRRNWEAAIKPISLPPATLPEVVIDTLDRFEDLAKRLGDAEIIEKRIEAIKREVGDYGQRVLATFAGKDKTVNAESTIHAVRSLTIELKSAQDALSRREQADKNRKQLEGLLKGATEKAIVAERQIERICAQVGVKSLDALADLMPRAMRSAQLKAAVDGLTKTLLALCPGWPIERIVAETEDHDLTTIDGALTELDPILVALEEQIDKLKRRHAEESMELKSMDGSDIAAERSELAAQLLARAEEQTAEYMRIRIAAAVLDRVILEYGEKNKAPLVHDASIIFSAITGGRYETLRAIEADDGTPTLIAVNASSNGALNREVEVAGLSEGTRDQLYFALRLASIRQLTTQIGPMPLLLDDVLINFDDERTGRALKQLALVARATQVVLFTHHRKVVDLANSTLDAGEFQLHELTA